MTANIGNVSILQKFNDAEKSTERKKLKRPFDYKTAKNVELGCKAKNDKTQLF